MTLVEEVFRQPRHRTVPNLDKLDPDNSSVKRPGYLNSCRHSDFHPSFLSKINNFIMNNDVCCCKYSTYNFIHLQLIILTETESGIAKPS